MTFFAVTYRYSDDAAALDEHRPSHRDFLRSLHEQDRVVAAGAFGTGGPPGALLLLSGDSADEVAQLLDRDPFHLHGLITTREVRPWNVVIGGVA